MVVALRFWVFFRVNCLSESSSDTFSNKVLELLSRFSKKEFEFVVVGEDDDAAEDRSTKSDSLLGLFNNLKIKTNLKRLLTQI